MTHQHERAGGVFRDLFGRQPQIVAARRKKDSPANGTSSSIPEPVSGP